MEVMAGNESCQQQMLDAVNLNRNGVFFVTGPWGLGKRSFLHSLVDPEERGLMVESNIDGIRSILDRTGTVSILEQAHDVVVLDCDRISVPAQDACLKLLEEPPPETRIWFHATDASGIGPALASRRRSGFRWLPLQAEEMEAWASTLGPVDKFSLEIAAGRPGIYSAMRPDPRFAMLHEAVMRAMSGSNLLLEPLPTLLAELDGESPLRESVVMTLCHAAKSSPARGLPVMRFASKLMNPALNVELHWFTAMSALGDRNG